jgi:hypothetical protein
MIRERHLKISPLLTDEGIFPPNFPENYEELMNMGESDINHWLTAYKYPVTYEVEDRRGWLKTYFGLKSL